MHKSSYFAVFIFMILLPELSRAQNPSSFYEEEPRTFYGGLLLGSNFTQVDGDNFAGYHKVGLNAGGIVYTHLGEKVAASMEILFSQKGSRSNKAQASNSKMYSIERYGIDLNYAEVPLQINYFDRRKSHFGGGFSFSQLITSNEYITSRPAFNEDTLTNFKFKKSDINFVLGGNLHLWEGLFLNIRFQYSLFSVRKNYHPEFGRAEQYNNMWTLRLMYLF
jgi:hypothetical protein